MLYGFEVLYIYPQKCSPLPPLFYVPWPAAGQPSKCRPWHAFKGSLKKENNPFSNPSWAAGALLAGFCSPELNQPRCLLYPDLEALWFLGSPGVKNFTRPRPTQAGSHQLTPTTNTRRKVKTNFAASHN